MGKAVENVSIGLRDRIAKRKPKEAEAAELREQRISAMEEKVFEELLQQKADTSFSSEMIDKTVQTEDFFAPDAKKRSSFRWFRRSKRKSKKLPEENLIDLKASSSTTSAETPKAYPRVYKREDNRHLWEKV